MTARRLLALLLIATGTACGDDPESPIIIPPPEYRALTNRSDVLHNLQLAYNERNITQYDKILDNGFTFFLAASDVTGGLPPQWDRIEEITLNTRLFATTKQPSDSWPLCTDINLDVKFEDALQWIEVSVSDEIWYTAIVYYDFEIDVEPDTRFRATSGARAQFTVRNAGTDDGPRWQLVEWRDLGAGSLISAASRTAPDETTWGGVKALYGGQP